MALLAAACGQKPASDPFAEGGKPAERIECQVGDAKTFTKDCAIERVEGPEGLVLTIHHPDGAFRRLRVTGDGRGVVSADGAEPATVTVTGDNQIEVAIGSDRYRLPATIRSGAKSEAKSGQ